MNSEFIVGSIFHPQKKTYVAAIGHEFHDQKGCYQFYTIGDKGHFRKVVTLDDRYNNISYEVYSELKNTRNQIG